MSSILSVIDQTLALYHASICFSLSFWIRINVRVNKYNNESGQNRDTSQYHNIFPILQLSKATFQHRLHYHY